jgi:hypothetical protein
MINRGFSLWTDLFEAVTPGPHFINARYFGEDFAHWLQAEFKKRGHTVSQLIQEDFCWVLLVTYHRHVCTLAIEIMDESIGSKLADWRLDVSFEKPLNGVRAWFRRGPAADLHELADLVEAILGSEQRIPNLASID